jgi:hypothetical protein
MMTLSDNPQVAEQQMQAIIFYLTTVGYIDGDFDISEKKFVRDYIRRVVEWRVASSNIDDVTLRHELVEKYTAHFHEVFQTIDVGIQELFHEVVAEGEDPREFVTAKLKLRCLEIFKGFDEENQNHLLQTVHALVAADGYTHPSEKRFLDELGALLTADITLEEDDIAEVAPPQMEIRQAADPLPKLDNHPFFGRIERHYSADPEVLREQAAADLALLDKAAAKLDEQRRAGEGKLAGKQSVTELASLPPFLDGHVYSFMPPPGQAVELIVLGDLHGCYSCLKGAIMQSDFMRKVQRHREDPKNNPAVKLVFLGDYIDRGMFSFNGILRTVLQLFLTVPDDVYVLRGNHEYYIEFNGRVYGGVKPAEAINTLIPHMPQEVFEGYMRFFEKLPNMLLFDKTLFVHAGIPRDDVIAEKYRDLSSLNDPDIRFQMLWSDPSEADFIPADLQKQNARFPFGRLQFRSFMARMGLNTMVRGHEKVDAGFKKIYDDGVVLLLNLFSAGGATNEDLPPESSYRSVTPMALTIEYKDGVHKATPWKIDYQDFNSPVRNAFFMHPPEIEFKAG